MHQCIPSHLAYPPQMTDQRTRTDDKPASPHPLSCTVTAQRWSSWRYPLSHPPHAAPQPGICPIINATYRDDRHQFSEVQFSPFMDLGSCMDSRLSTFTVSMSVTLRLPWTCPLSEGDQCVSSPAPLGHKAMLTSLLEHYHSMPWWRAYCVV